jgi:hypothetical protein
MTSVLDGYLVDPKVSLLDKTRIQAQVLVPVFRALRAELGKDKADAVVKQALRDWSKQLFAAIGEGIEGSPRRKWATLQSVWDEVSGKDVEFEILRHDAGYRRDALPLRRIPPRAGRTRTRRAANMRGGFRHRFGGRRQGQPRPRADDHARRPELHLPLQIRAAVIVSAKSPLADPPRLIGCDLGSRSGELGGWDTLDGTSAIGARPSLPDASAKVA